MNEPIIEKTLVGVWGETNVKLKLLGALYTKRMGFVTCYPLIAKEGARIWEGWDTPDPSFKLC